MSSKKEIEKIKLLIPDYVSGLLGDEEKKYVEQYLNSSSELRDFYDEVSLAFTAIDKIKYTEPSPGYWINLLPRIHQRIEEKEEAESARNTFTKWWKVLVPVSAVILIVIIYMLFKPAEQQMTKKEKQDTIQQTEQKKEEIPETKEKITAKEQQPVKKDILKSAKTNLKKPGVVKEQLVEEKVENYVVTQVKNKALIKDITEEFASDEVSESILFGGAGSFDEEIESELDKLSTLEQDLMLEKLIKTDI